MSPYSDFIQSYQSKLTELEDYIGVVSSKCRYSWEQSQHGRLVGEVVFYEYREDFCRNKLEGMQRCLSDIYWERHYLEGRKIPLLTALNNQVEHYRQKSLSYRIKDRQQAWLFGKLVGYQTVVEDFRSWLANGEEL